MRNEEQVSLVGENEIRHRVVENTFGKVHWSQIMNGLRSGKIHKAQLKLNVFDKKQIIF